MGPPSFQRKGPKAPPGPIELQAQDFAFPEEHKPPVSSRGASDLGTLRGQTSPEVKEPMHFSAASAAHAFSGSQARSSRDDRTALQCHPPPCGNSPRPAPRFQPYHAVCSQHGRGGSWRIGNYCRECDNIAIAALNET